MFVRVVVFLGVEVELDVDVPGVDLVEFEL